MNITPRHAIGALSASLALTIVVAVGASAQVATLVSPDESPEPEAVEAVLEFDDPGEAMLAYAQCLRDNGIDVDDPQAGSIGARGILGGGPDSEGPTIDRRSEEFIAANEACGYLLEASRPEIDPAAEQERLEEQLALAQCIRDQGFESYPDPAIGSDGRLERMRGQEMQEIGIDMRSSEFREAIGICRDQMGLEDGPGLGGGFGRGGGS
jgi:hypothetical protein